MYVIICFHGEGRLEIIPKLASLKLSSMKNSLFSIGLILLFSVSLIAQDADTTSSKREEKVKTGFSLGGVPVVAYDSDVGFKYGALLNLYWYGDGSRYPMYDHSVYIEWSRTTKGNGINQITYDTDKLIPGIRSFFEASYLTEKALDFYGFNGYKAIYDPAYEASWMIWATPIVPITGTPENFSA